MRFDPDLARAILLDIEKTPANREPDDVEVEGYSDDEISEHIELLNDGRYLEARIARSGSGQARIFHISVIRLTLRGHEFLAAARNETVWQESKNFVTSRGGAMTLDTLTGVLTRASRDAMERKD